MASTPIHVLDDYYLVITLLVTIVYQLFFFSIAYTCRFDKLTDLAGGTNFAVLAILTLALSSGGPNSGNGSGIPSTRQLVVSLFMMVWSLRLSGFLFFRILKTGKDDRFDHMRDKFFKFLGFWVYQMLWVWICSLPVTVLNSPAVQAFPQVAFGTGRDIAGVVLYAIGLTMESVSDAQKYQFRKKGDKGAILDSWFFSWTRHPSYFGDIIVQFSIYMIAVSAAADGYVTGSAYNALYATILGPFFITFLLMFVSGLPLTERSAAKKRYENGNNWDGYSRYLQRTSVLIPFPPQIYKKLPTIVKQTLLLEFPMYVFDPAKHSDAALIRGAGQMDDGSL